MTTAHRTKQPEKVRRALLDAAARIATQRGVADVTVEAVCAGAGVTKGAFFHHFPTKAALITSVFADLLERFELCLERLCAADPEPHGRFTRAYLHAVAQPGTAGSEPLWAALYLSALTDPDLRRIWAEWLARKLDAAGETDADPALRTVRLAADGLWLADLAGAGTEGAARASFLAHLVALTRSKAP